MAQFFEEREQLETMNWLSARVQLHLIEEFVLKWREIFSSNSYRDEVDVSLKQVFDLDFIPAVFAALEPPDVHCLAKPTTS